MKVHWILVSGRLLCGRLPVRTPYGYSKAAGTPTRTTRIEPEVTCRACLHRLAALGEGAQP